MVPPGTAQEEMMLAEALRDEIRSDYTMAQPVARYTAADHAMWHQLFERQAETLKGRACDEFLDGLAGLGATREGIPDFERLSEALARATGWRIVAVPGLVPDAVFFAHLAARRFPVTWWIRKAEQMDYLQEPDVFHDVYGHVPLLMNPIFGDYMQAYGEGGLKALRLGALNYLARLYWYTVEFGLIRTARGLRIYGSGIVSSKTESLYCLESAAPNRIGFDARRIMRTGYRLDTFQKSYFVIDGFEELFEATRPDFTPLYAELSGLPQIPSGEILATDRVLHRGTREGWDPRPDA
jgi:phenylalanine-4-hydroxylase